MIQFWEENNVDDSNCLNPGNDTPFHIPLAYTDFINLRLNIPYVLIEDNGGGIPTSFKVEVMNGSASTLIGTYGLTSSGKFIYTYINDSDRRIAEYKLLLPPIFKDVEGNSYKVYKFPVSNGDKIHLDVNGTIYYFKYGVDDLPFPIIEYKSGGNLCIGISSADYAFTELKINGTLTALTSLVTTDPTAIDYYPDCFRFKVTITFGTAGVTGIYHTKTYKLLNECESSVFLESQYPTDTLDCTGMLHNQGDTVIYPGKIWMRMHADIENTKSRLKVTINSKCHAYKSERTKMAKLKSDPFPEWYGDAFEAFAGAQTFRVDGTQYLIDEVDSVLNDSDFVGYANQYIDLPLQQCKCESVFVC